MKLHRLYPLITAGNKQQNKRSDQQQPFANITIHGESPRNKASDSGHMSVVSADKEFIDFLFADVYQ
jgi:hypothetical protein